MCRLTLASQRSLPSCISQSETPRYRSVSRSSSRQPCASAGLRISGSVTISRSGMPARLRSTSESPPAACMSLPVSSSRWTRVSRQRPPPAAVLPGGDLDPAAPGERQVVLADLIVLGQVGIVVVLAVPLGERRDLGMQRHGRLAAPARTPCGSSPAASPAAPARPGRSACSAAGRTRCRTTRTSCSRSGAGRGLPGR